ncbi:MAG: hypothetical protein IPH52_11870 [Leptospiraceae bacterium]|nr:hypothetical protein [Leptospiraceae bacterium]
MRREYYKRKCRRRNFTGSRRRKAKANGYHGKNLSQVKEEGKIRDIPPYLLAGSYLGHAKGALDVIVSGYFKQEIADEEMFFALVENLLFYGLFKSEEKLK